MMMVKKDFFIELHTKMTSELANIRKSEADTIRLAKESFNTVKSYTIELRKYVLDIGFTTEQDEVEFFKEIKPMFYKFLIYFSKLIHFELAKPTGGLKAQKKYLRLHQERIVHFFKKYQDFYKYLREGASYMDKHFFLRIHQALSPHPDLEGIDKDKDFSTSHDYLVSKVSANEMLEEYLTQETRQLTAHATVMSDHDNNVLSWTGSKASLTELLYALSCKGVFNQGNSSLQQIAVFFEKMFNVKLGNYYRAFQELRIRKKRTQFLDELKNELIQKMDNDDWKQ